LDSIALLESMVELTGCTAAAKITKLEIEMEGKLAILTNDFKLDCAAIARKYETPTPAEGSVDGEGAPATLPSVEFMREEAESASARMDEDFRARSVKLKEREASLLRSHEASVAVITSESAVQCGKQRTSAPFATIEKLLKTVWQASWEALYKHLQGFFPVAVWLRLEDGVGEDDNSYDKVLIIMSALQELRQFSTFSAQVNKIVLTVGPPTGLRVPLEIFLAAENLASMRLRAFLETYKLVESMAFYRPLESMPRNSSRWTNLRAEMYVKAPELVDRNQLAALVAWMRSLVASSSG